MYYFCTSLLLSALCCKTVCCGKKGDKGLGWFCTERPLGRRNDENDKLSNAAKDGDFNDGESLMTVMTIKSMIMMLLKSRTTIECLGVVMVKVVEMLLSQRL